MDFFVKHKTSIGVGVSLHRSDHAAYGCASALLDVCRGVSLCGGGQSIPRLFQASSLVGGLSFSRAEARAELEMKDNSVSLTARQPVCLTNGAWLLPDFT